ncbi:MAG: cobalt-precorrin 5A hydrolase [Nitrospirota bacterium]|mgnify:CR=1 FL=1
MKIAIVAITKNGCQLGERLIAKMKADADLFIPERFRDEVKANANIFDGHLDNLVVNIFPNYSGLVFIMAAGIVVRMIAGLIKDKRVDPAVVVMDEKGDYAISLLSGHLGGANELSRKCALATGAIPVITTATDVNNKPSIDMIAKELNLVVENYKAIKIINAAIVNNERIGIVDRYGLLKRYFSGEDEDNVRYYSSVTYAVNVNASAYVFLTNRDNALFKKAGNVLFLRPINLVVGIGCNRNTKASEIEKVYFKALKENNLSPLSVRNIATIDVKKNEKGLNSFIKKHNFDVIYYTKDELNRIEPPSGESENALKNVGAKGVCEPAAILSSWAKALLVKKQKIGNVTIAVAEAPFIS